MIIDTLVEASNHYSQSLNAKIYFELAMLKICNQVKEESVLIPASVETILPIKQEAIKLESSSMIEEPVIEQVPIVEPGVETQIEKSIEEIQDKQMEQESVIKEREIEKQEILSQDEVIQPEEVIPEEILEEISETLVEEPTIEEKKNPSIDIEVTFEDILNILVQANRSVLEEIKEKWGVIARYRYNLNTAKLASMLYDGTPVAAAKGGIIIAFDHQPQVNDINNSENYHHLKTFLKEVLGEGFDFIGVKASDWLAIRGKFIDLKNQSALPKAKPITLQHIKEYVEPVKQLNDAQQFAIDMFGEDIVEIEE